MLVIQQRLKIENMSAALNSAFEKVKPMEILPEVDSYKHMLPPNNRETVNQLIKL